MRNQVKSQTRRYPKLQIAQPFFPFGFRRCCLSSAGNEMSTTVSCSSCLVASICTPIASFEHESKLFSLIKLLLPTLSPPSFQSPGIIAANPAIVSPKNLAFFLEQNQKKSGRYFELFGTGSAHFCYPNQGKSSVFMDDTLKIISCREKQKTLDALHVEVEKARLKDLCLIISQKTAKLMQRKSFWL